MRDSAADKGSAAAVGRSVRICTGSRLHFGLLDTAPPFGGIGVMISHPVTEVVVTPSERFDPGPIETSRIQAIAARITQHVAAGQTLGCRVHVKRLAPQHTGLGSGTQLAMAVTDAICRCLGFQLEPTRLATTIAGRGQRSAVGIHGYLQGGLIYESGGDRPPGNAIKQRVELPLSWHVLVVRPRSPHPTVSGDIETQQFDRLTAADRDTVAKLRHMIETEIMPAAVASHFDGFTTAITRYNAASGELFRAVQGGAYNGPAVTSMVQWLQAHGVAGVGQSSWGPGVFGWFENQQAAEQVVANLPDSMELVTITQPLNRGCLY